MTSTSRLIRQARTDTTMTQTEVALNLDCSSQFFSSIENGKSRLPARLLHPVAELLGIPKKKLQEAMVCDFREQLIQESLHSSHR
jgi:transcriptional regulator with XRE-family HTH domain